MSCWQKKFESCLNFYDIAIKYFILYASVNVLIFWFGVTTSMPIMLFRQKKKPV